MDTKKIMNNETKQIVFEDLYSMVSSLPAGQISFPEIALNIINIFVDKGIAENSSIYLKDEESNKLYLVAARDKSRRAFTASNIKLYSGARDLPFKWFFEEGEGIAGSAHVNKKAVYVPDLDKDRRFVGSVTARKKLLVLPLLIGKESIGIMNISTTGQGLSDPSVRDSIEKLSRFYALLIHFSKVYSKYLTASFLLSSLIQYTDKAILMLDKEDRIIDFNNTASNIFPVKSNDLLGMRTSSFNPKSEEKLKDYIRDVFGSKTLLCDKILSNKGIISQIPFDDLDNKVIIKAIKEFPDGKFIIFDIVRLKVINKSEESIGSVEIWSTYQKEADQKKSTIPLVDSGKINRIISRMNLIKNEIEAGKVNREFLLKHINTSALEMKGILEPGSYRNLNTLINTSFRIYNDHNNLGMTYFSNIPHTVSMEYLPYKIIQLFYLIIDIVVQFGNPSKPVNIKYLMQDSKHDTPQIMLIISNDDLHIPKRFMNEFSITHRELRSLLEELNADIDIVKNEELSSVSLSFGNNQY